MKVLKIIAIVILIIIAIPLIAALFVPKTYTVSVTETINQPKEKVYDYMRLLKNQKDYSVWVMQDSTMTPEIIGTDGTVGVTQKWNSANDNVGEGEQQITALTPERMDVDLRFKRPFEGEAKAANIFKSVSDNQTQVTMEFYSKESYPMNLPSYLFGRKYVEDASRQNLLNVKRILEKQ
jgi:hypothetical protein